MTVNWLGPLTIRINAENGKTTDLSSWTVENLLAMKQCQLLKLFQTLPAPSIQELQGEFKGSLLHTGSWWFIKDIFAYFALRSYFVNGKWQGKAFKAISNTEGLGYNIYKKSGHIRHILPMKTCVTTSRIDGKEVFQLDYTTYDSKANFVNMVDEVRKINDNLYLGIGYWGFIKFQRRLPFFFALSGPPKKYVERDRSHEELPSRIIKDEVLSRPLRGAFKSLFS